MSENPSITARANQILAMLTEEEKDKAVRKSLWPFGVPPTALFLAEELARQEHRSGKRTAKLALPKALAKIGQNFKQI